ncbi:DUF5060 domain-containing protein [Promicromonospora sukumoe]|uniref:DUF5060 domain-containing protein n=1 Tax=Promicromonospora sukumoe TaxID=88382 RepID=UPI00035C9D66|nr:DUF5060 domain-containing protein [Promicromonospora sukumoe]
MEITRRTAVTGAAILGAAAAVGLPTTASASGRTAPAAPAPGTVERWGLHEIVLNGPDKGNPFVDVTLAAVFRSGDQRIKVPGFYDGEGTYRIRFSPPQTGAWSWSVESNVRALRKSGRVTVVEPAAGNHGPVQVVPDGYHFVYADGSPYRQIGTTSYSWALQGDEKCAVTLDTLSKAPFNKIRMLVFPNVPAAYTDPFVRTGTEPGAWDPTRFDPAYFRNYERRIAQLLELGIQADVVLYHPYDEDRGYSDMARADDERYVRYVSARFGAYRNVWWSMANEYDGVDSKSVDDWDHLFEVLVAADPHDRLRSIHNANIYYDARKPWITHASVQSAGASMDGLRAHLHRQFALKPVVFDEVAYEGNISERWGQLSGEEMTSRFWNTYVGGTYCGHGETLNPEQKPSISWLGQGGTLNGTSAPRLAFLKQVMEDGPAPGINALQPDWDYEIAGVDNQYFVKYFDDATPTEWAAVLPNGAGLAFKADIIDTWNMTVTPAGTFNMAKVPRGAQDPARPNIELPGKPWIAVRFTKA